MEPASLAGLCRVTVTVCAWECHFDDMRMLASICAFPLITSSLGFLLYSTMAPSCPSPSVHNTHNEAVTGVTTCWLHAITRSVRKVCILSEALPVSKLISWSGKMPCGVGSDYCIGHSLPRTNPLIPVWQWWDFVVMDPNLSSCLSIEARAQSWSIEWATAWGLGVCWQAARFKGEMFMCT